jgi:DNA-binding transcriptional regulator GbsR (MarR family)
VEAREMAISKHWTLISSHGIVLFYIAGNPQSTMREIGEAAGISERRVAGLIKDLDEAGLIQVTRAGRRNRYKVNPHASFRHPSFSHIKLERFVRLLGEASAVPARAAGSGRPSAVL